MSALNLADRVTVLCSEIEALTRDPKWAKSFDAAISRGLGPPIQTLKLSTELVVDGGVVVISEPPPATESRWEFAEISSLGLDGPERLGAVAMFHVKPSYP